MLLIRPPDRVLALEIIDEGGLARFERSVRKEKGIALVGAVP